ncbi:hypothetical protein LguiB_017605 [Lonicera macranthoides]
MTVSDLSSCFDDGKFFPPGFRFHPTDEELVLYYLKRKICRRKLKLDIISETDVYKWDPEELPGISKLKTGDRQWFFFSPRDRKYPNAARSNRATMHGYWKATGKDRTISCNSRSVGIKKTLVYYGGRAPSGLRTDWVMHEYTLDEEELKRCQNAKDYYALYKVYKKSGPGPKNGEQYGAPFKEEEWADDECSDFNALVPHENLVKEGNNVISVENTKAVCVQPQLINDLEEFMNRIADEPVEQFDIDFPYALNQLVGEEETQSILVDDCPREDNLHDQTVVQHIAQASFGLTQSDTSQFQLYDGPAEVTSAPNVGGPGPPVTEEDFLEDFLEMDDLTGPEPTVQNFEEPVENLLFDEMNGLSEVDLYQDPSMFFGGMGEFLQPYLNNLENGMPNEGTLSYLNNINIGAENCSLNGEPDAVSHSYLSNTDNGMENYELQPYSTNANQMGYQTWRHDQRCSVFTPAEANQGVIPPPTSGAVYDCNLENLAANASNQIQNGSGNAKDSWFSSALWSWLESVPTSPASAAESPIASRAFKRLSSFSRLRTSTRNTNDAAARKRLDRSTSMFLCFLILGVVCAMLGVLIRTSLNVSGRYTY